MEIKIGEKKLRVIKTAPASRSYGRGFDNNRTPARYKVVFDGVNIGDIWASPACMFERSRWYFDGAIKKVPLAFTRRDLIRMLVTRLEESEGIKRDEV